MEASVTDKTTAERKKERKQQLVTFTRTSASGSYAHCPVR